METPEQIAQQIAGCPDYHLQGFLNPPICCIYRRQIVRAIEAERERVRALEREQIGLETEAVCRTAQAFQPEPPIWATWPEMDMHGEKCGDCGAWCTVVRPGKTQCDVCPHLDAARRGESND